MCYTTLVMEDGDLPKDDKDVYSIDTSMGKFTFVQSPKGVIPALLEDLAQYRKQAKKDMARAKEEGDEWQAALYNGKQLAYKITMNRCGRFV